MGGSRWIQVISCFSEHSISCGVDYLVALQVWFGQDTGEYACNECFWLLQYFCCPETYVKWLEILHF